MFSVRNLQEPDYEVLVTWWKDWKWTPPPRDFLPQNGIGGIMIEKDGQAIVAGFLYLTNSAVAWSEFIISNKEYRDKDRKDAILFLISELTRIAKECGYKYVYTVVKNKNLQEHYLKIGYANGSQKVNEMFIEL